MFTHISNIKTCTFKHNFTVINLKNNISSSYTTNWHIFMETLIYVIGESRNW